MQDCLGSISYWWPTVSAGDCGETAQLHELEAGFNNTSKHLMGMVQGERSPGPRSRWPRRWPAEPRSSAAGPS